MMLWGEFSSFSAMAQRSRSVSACPSDPKKKGEQKEDRTQRGTELSAGEILHSFGYIRLSTRSHSARFAPAVPVIDRVFLQWYAPSRNLGLEEGPP
jgi:hypothetical protein